jgi:hypothetical protein
MIYVLPLFERPCPLTHILRMKTPRSRTALLQRCVLGLHLLLVDDIIVAILRFVLSGTLLLYTARLLRVRETGLLESKYSKANHCD